MIDHPAQKIAYAFPFTIGEGNGHGEIQIFGMTLRDYFAAAVISGRMANPHWCESEVDDAEFAYEVADSMIAERAK